MEPSRVEMPDDLIRLVDALAEVPGVAAVALGGSRASGTASAASDYDFGLYFTADRPLDPDGLRAAIRPLVDDPDHGALTQVGQWGPWIVGGGWLSVGGRKVDLLYRDAGAVGQVIRDGCAGRVTMHYQPGHPHGFCSAIWIGEAALCKPLHDSRHVIDGLKALTTPYPDELRTALVRQFQWEILFSIENGEIAVARGEQTHIAGCVYRALCCLAQVLFALNRRYLINEKGALPRAASLPLALADLNDRVSTVWRAVGAARYAAAFAILRALNDELRGLSHPSSPRSDPQPWPSAGLP